MVSFFDYMLVLTKYALIIFSFVVVERSLRSMFNEKYENFIENINGMASAIREKRQSELQSILERNIAFKQESERLLAKAEEEALAPLRNKLDNAIKALGSENNYIVILNTDNNAVPYINPMMGEDVTEILIDRIR